MVFEAILNEVEQLHHVGRRLDDLASQHPLVSDALTTIAESIRNTAIVLAVLVATRTPKPI